MFQHMHEYKYNADTQTPKQFKLFKASSPLGTISTHALKPNTNISSSWALMWEDEWPSHDSIRTV